MSVSHYRQQIESVVANRKWLVVSDSTVEAYHRADELAGLGANPLFVLGAFRGLGRIPVDSPHTACTLGVRGRSSMDTIRGAIAAFRTLPPDVCAQIDRWDPDRTAKVIGPMWDDDSPVHQRPVFGARWPQWQALENKMLCDSIWDVVGIPRAPALVLPVYQSAIENAHKTLDEGLGTVWAGDNKEGWHGGAEYLRWVRTENDFSGSFPFFRSHCDQVRIQAFMEGIPCSIHGMVFPDAVIAFRPCEMLVFRRPDSNRLTYAGAATAWDPPQVDREFMRTAAQRVGSHLRAQYGYRGVFTLDGIMTKQGFLPTELNPRFGAAMRGLTSSLPDLPLFLIHRALCEGIELDYQPRRLEELVLDAAEQHRVAEARFSLSGHEPVAKQTIHFEYTATGWEAAPTPTHATVTIGSDGPSTYLKVSIETSALQPGSSPAPVIAHLARRTANELGHGLADLEAAPDVRT